MASFPIRLLTFLLCLCALCAGWAADWPQFRGPNRDGISPERGINKAWATKAPDTLWKVAMSDRGYAGPSVAGGKVFIIDHQGDKDVVRALSLKSGDEVWSFSYAEASRDNYGFSRSTPTVAGGKVFTLSQQGLLHCLDAATGKKLWACDLVKQLGGQRPKWEMAGSPLVDGEKVIVCPGGPNAAVAALDKDTGRVIWKGGGSDKPGYATPVAATIGGKKQYVVFTAVNLIGVDAGNGKLLWSYPWKTDYDVNAATPIVMGNTIFITSGYKHGCALLEVSGGKANLKWENTAIQAHFSSPIVSGGYIYGTGDPGNLVCLDPKTGAVKWSQGGFEKGGIVAADGVILALSGNKGDLVMAELTPTAYKELGRIKPLGGQSWTAPIIADGKLLVRNKTTLACLDLK